MRRNKTRTGPAPLLTTAGFASRALYVSRKLSSSYTLSRHIRGLKKPSLGAATTTASLINCHRHGAWILASARSNATKEYSARLSPLATSGGYARTSTCLLGFTLGGASQWRLRAGSSRPTPPGPCRYNKKGHTAYMAWTISHTHAAKPMQNNARALELLLSNNALSPLRGLS